MKIQMQNKKECYRCWTTQNLERHHVMFGSHRKKSEKYGLVVWLCAEHHRGNDGVHFNRQVDINLKKHAQQRFEEKYSHEFWMREFGRNYL